MRSSIEVEIFNFELRKKTIQRIEPKNGIQKVRIYLILNLIEAIIKLLKAFL